MEDFIGEHTGKVDSKGRLVFPFRFKERLPSKAAEEVILQLGLGPYLVLYPKPVYKSMKARIDSLDEFNEQHRQLRRSFYRGSYAAPLDKLGRILLPPNFMRYASLNHEVILVGVGQKIELWNPERYQTHILSDPDQYSQMASRLMGDA